MKNILKQIEWAFFLRGLLVVAALAVTGVVQADPAGNESNPAGSVKNTTANPGTAAIVGYDRASDELNVIVDSVSLKSVLGRIAQQSGIEVLFDELADGTVSFNIQSQPLEAGLKEVLKGRNHLMRYSRDDQHKLLLIGIIVLPAGEQDSGRARRLLAIETEAYYRASSQLSIQQSQQMDVANERWQARLSELPPENRQRLEKKVAARLHEEAQRKQWRAEQNKKQAQQFAERKQQRLKAQERMLQGLDPEQRAVFEQRRKESSEQMKARLFGG